MLATPPLSCRCEVTGWWWWGVVVWETWLWVPCCVWWPVWAPPLSSTTAQNSGHVLKCRRVFYHLPQPINWRTSCHDPVLLHPSSLPCISTGAGKAEAPLRPTSTKPRLSESQLCLSWSWRCRTWTVEARCCVWVSEARDRKVWRNGWIRFRIRLDVQL